MTNFNYLYNTETAAEYFGKNHHVDKSLGITIFERATVLPYKSVPVNDKWTWGVGGLVDGNGNFVKESFVHYGVGDAYTPTEIRRSDKTVVYLGLFFPVWGHCLTDNILRLWFLTTDEFKTYFKNCPLVYAPWNISQDEGGDLIFLEHQKNFWRLLEILGVDVDKLQAVTQPTQFDNVILPDESFFTDGSTRFFTDEYRMTIDRVKNFALKNRTPSPKKIYFFYGRNQSSEDCLAEYLRTKGYEIVSPEQLTLDEQLNLLINAQNFASTLGSCAHNSIFLRDGTDVILIPRAAEYFSDYQSALDQVYPLNITYVDSTLSIFEAYPKNLGPFCFVLSRELKNFFGDDFDGYDDDDLKNFLEYMILCRIHHVKQNPSAINYYGAMLKEIMSQLKARPDLTAAYGLNLS